MQTSHTHTTISWPKVETCFYEGSREFTFICNNGWRMSDRWPRWPNPIGMRWVYGFGRVEWNSRRCSRPYNQWEVIIWMATSGHQFWNLIYCHFGVQLCIRFAINSAFNSALGVLRVPFRISCDFNVVWSCFVLLVFGGPCVVISRVSIVSVGNCL